MERDMSCSQRTEPIQINSRAVSMSEQYLASVELLDTVGCFMEDLQMRF